MTVKKFPCYVAVALSVASLIAFAAEPESGDASSGKRLFMAYGCYECHGTTGAGGGFAGPKIAPSPLPLAGIKAKLRTASGRMPVFTEALLTDTQVADIYAYLLSMPPARNPRDIDILSH
jgi:mono/diheme cytochrome c family protein